jgi:hypothetical protein
VITRASNVRHVIRPLTSQPAATTVVVLAIAVAIATTTVIYSVIDPPAGSWDWASRSFSQPALDFRCRA